MRQEQLQEFLSICISGDLEKPKEDLSLTNKFKVGKLAQHPDYIRHRFDPDRGVGGLT